MNEELVKSGEISPEAVKSLEAMKANSAAVNEAVLEAFAREKGIQPL